MNPLAQHREVVLITVRPAPAREPLFDDELSARHLRVVGPYDQPLPFPSAPRRVRLERPDAFAVRQTGRRDLPDPTMWGRRLLIAIIESMAGRRSLRQLAPHLSAAVHHGLATDAERAARHRHWVHSASVRRVRVCEPADGVAELAAVIRSGTRYRAIAARLEGLDGRWRCTRLEIG
jgi:Family of unknown function (DUF6459)